MIKYSENVKKEDLDKLLQRKLDLLEIYCEIDVIVSSGLRSPEKNAKIGGSPTSSHLKGLAVDILYKNGAEAQQILNCARWAGFRRIGLGKSHIHLDIDKEKTQDIFFWEK